MKHIMNKEKVDFTKQPMYLGEGLNLQRYDVYKNKYFYDSFQQQLSSFWRPEEVNVSLDSDQFKRLSVAEQNVFTKNLKYQILLDSVASRALPYVSQLVSNPEIEAAMSAWALFETIHSYSYTYIIKNVYNDPSEVFDSILDDEQILKRADSLTKYYDDLINSLGDSEYDIKKKIYLTLISVNILEGIRFYVSFACAYSFAETGRMEGNAKIVSLINRDENIHLGMGTTILRKLAQDEDEGFVQVAKDCREHVIEMYKEAAEEEIEWCDYLFEDGGILGLNADILAQYMKWLTNKRMKSLGFESLYPDAKNPISWIDSWTSSKSVQVAPQETEIESYKIGSFENDVKNADFSMEF